MSNLELYDKVKSVPENAQKKILAGRLQGMTDIKPIWRIKVLTEQFGICGIGWKAPIIEKWLENGSDGIKSCFIRINLFIKLNEQWSEGIEGIGGSCFVAKESKGLHTSDECFKMAYTDALSVSCKMLGIGADVYWGKENSKYTKYETLPEKKTIQDDEKIINKVVVVDANDEVCPICGKSLQKRKSKYGEFFGCSGYPECRYIKKDDDVQEVIGNYAQPEDDYVYS